MGTFQQLLKSTSPGRRQRWLVCGDDVALRQDAYELALDHVCVPGLDVERSTFLGGETAAYQLEEALLSDTLADRKLVVLLDAERFEHLNMLPAFLNGLPNTVFFIAVFDGEPSDAFVDVFKNSSKARHVVCNNLNDDGLKLWVTSRLRITPGGTERLLEKAKGDTVWLLNQMRKLEMLTGVVGEQHVNLLCRDEGYVSFEDALIRQDRKTAAMRLSEVDRTTHNRLSGMLRNMTTIYVASRVVGTGMRLLSDRTGLRSDEISDLKKHAVYYDGRTSTRCFASLVKLQNPLLRGSREAFASLVARW